MASSSAAWVFGGVRLISSASSSPVNSGPGRNANSPVPLVVDERPGQVGRQQVRGELGPGELQPERLRERAGREGLAEAGQVLEQDVAAGEHARRGPASAPRACRRPRARPRPARAWASPSSPAGRAPLVAVVVTGTRFCSSSADSAAGSVGTCRGSSRKALQVGSERCRARSGWLGPDDAVPVAQPLVDETGQERVRLGGAGPSRRTPCWTVMRCRRVSRGSPRALASWITGCANQAGWPDQSRQVHDGPEDQGHRRRRPRRGRAVTGAAPPGSPTPQIAAQPARAGPTQLVRASRPVTASRPGGAARAGPRAGARARLRGRPGRVRLIACRENLASR